MDQKNTHILIVEDDTFLLNIYKTKFEFENFKVSTAENGEVGLAEARKKHPDLILLDILMPKVDGFTFLQELKKDKTIQDIPVILLTNLGQKDDVQKGLDLGAKDYIIKAHFKPSEILEKVRKVLGS